MLSKLGSRSFSVLRIPEKVEHEDRSGDWPATWEELGSPGGGMNKNRKSGGGGGNGGFGSGAEPNNIGAYYLELIKSDPTNSLVLRNYGKYLHEVRNNMSKVEPPFLFKCQNIFLFPFKYAVLKFDRK